MKFQRTTKTGQLTAEDRELFGRIAYAMVVVGLWKNTVRRTDQDFDFFEVRGQQGQLAYRLGRMVEGDYILFNLMTGGRKRGASLTELLRTIAYVPRAS